MRTRLLAGVAVVSVLASVVAVHPATARETAPTAAPPSLASPHLGTWGYDASGRGSGIRPGDDFFRFANGGWLDTTEIPADKSRWGMFNILIDLSDARVRDLIETSAARPETSADAGRIGALYGSFMDEARIEALGHQPIDGLLNDIRATTDRPALAAVLGAGQSGFMPAFIGNGVTPDARNPQVYSLVLVQDGLGLPDRDYYLQPSFAAAKAAYQAYIAHQLAAVGWPEPEARAADVLAFETRIAEVSWPQTDIRDSEKRYNARTLDEVKAEAPGFDWDPWLRASGYDRVTHLVDFTPSALTGMARLWGETPLPVLQAWAAFHTVNSASPYLSSPFVQAAFDFNGRTLSGQQEDTPRWKRGTDLVNGQLPDAVGRLYVQRYYTPQARAGMTEMIANLQAALAIRIRNNDWMSDETKARALEKLSQFDAKIGEPAHYRDYSALELRSDDLVGNLLRSAVFEAAYQRAHIGQAVDRSDWNGITPQTVNAGYRQTYNDVTFPTAILEAPFFDPAADPAINYGAIGGVIGHEITHGFDDQGRKSDGTGRLHDWWTAEDATRFQARADRLGAQYEALPMFPDAHINGQLTMGENIADLGGLLMALDAYHASLHGRPAPVIDGLTGDQRVFLGWAQVWRAKDRESAARRRLVSDPHSPSMARVNGVVRNIDAWYDAFGIKPGDPMYLPPEQRVRLW